MAEISSIHLLVAENNPVLREALVTFFDEKENIKVVGQATDTDETLSLCERLQPHVILMDSKLRPINILVLIGRLCNASPDTRIVVLTSHYDETIAEKYLEAGASIAVMEGIFASDLLLTIQQVHRLGS